MTQGLSLISVFELYCTCSSMIAESAPPLEWRQRLPRPYACVRPNDECLDSRSSPSTAHLSSAPASSWNKASLCSQGFEESFRARRPILWFAATLEIHPQTGQWARPTAPGGLVQIPRARALLGLDRKRPCAHSFKACIIALLNSRQRPLRVASLHLSRFLQLSQPKQHIPRLFVPSFTHSRSQNSILVECQNVQKVNPSPDEGAEASPGY